MKKTYDLTILDQKFTIKSDESEAHVKKVSDYVNKKMNEIVTRNKAISTGNIAVLAALNIAGDLFELKRNVGDEAEKWMSQIDSVLAEIESQN